MFKKIKEFLYPPRKRRELPLQRSKVRITRPVKQAQVEKSVNKLVTLEQFKSSSNHLVLEPQLLTRVQELIHEIEGILYLYPQARACGELMFYSYETLLTLNYSQQYVKLFLVLDELIEVERKHSKASLFKPGILIIDKVEG